MRIHINASGMGVKMDDVETLFFFFACCSGKNVWFSQWNRLFPEPDSKTEDINSQTIFVVFVSLLGYHFLALQSNGLA